MFTPRRLFLCGLMVFALSACSNLQKSTKVSASGKLASRGSIDDPRKKHLLCLRQHRIHATEPSSTEIQVGTPGVGPLIKFLSTPGMAQGAQIAGQSQAAEVIGSALLYPNQGSGSQLMVIETCVALGVNG